MLSSVKFNVQFAYSVPFFVDLHFLKRIYSYQHSTDTSLGQVEHQNLHMHKFKKFKVWERVSNTPLPAYIHLDRLYERVGKLYPPDSVFLKSQLPQKGIKSNDTRDIKLARD